MFTTRVEDQIKEAVNKQTSLNLTSEDIHKMKMIPISGNEIGGRSILCLQKGIFTIMVEVKISDDGRRLFIKEVKQVTW